MANTQLSVSTEPRKLPIGKYIALAAVVCVIVIVLLLAFVYPGFLKITTSSSSETQLPTYSQGGLSFSYPSTWTVLNLTGVNYVPFLLGSEVAVLSPSNLASSVLSAMSSGVPLSSNFSVLSISYNSTSTGSLAESALPQNVESILSSATSQFINNSASLGSCSGILFEAYNVSYSILAVSGSGPSQPNVFLFSKAICSNKQYEVVGEASGQNQITQLLNQYYALAPTV